MNVESSTVSSAKSSGTTSSSATATVNKDSSTSFKDELNSVKTQDAKQAEAAEVETQDAQAQASKTSEEQNVKTSQENISQQVKKDELLTEQDALFASIEKNDVLASLADLNTKIATVNDLKSNFGKELDGILSKNNDKINSDYCAVMNMDNQDVSFFLSLTDNQQMMAQASSGSLQNNSGAVSFTDVKAEATQKTVQVSQAMLDALNESAKTGKPIRIDFDGDVSVIMKLSKDGVISANFIPGNAAAESFLKNNLAGLRQNFDDKNIAYNELSYKERQNENQQQKQHNNKENENE